MKTFRLGLCAALFAVAFPSVAVRAAGVGDCTAVRTAVLPAPSGFHTLEHCVQAEPGVFLYVVERYIDQAPPSSTHRALVLMPPSLVTSALWNSEGLDPTYNGLTRGAAQGFFTFSFDYWGYGRSSKPPSGLSVTRERLLVQSGALVEWVRARTGAERVDLAGYSVGGLLAFALGGTESPIPSWHIGHVVLNDVVYKTASPALQATLLGPPGCAVQENSPNGYEDIPGAFYLVVGYNNEVAPLLWCIQNCGGTYAAGPTLTGCHLPLFEASTGRAPALVLFGDRDVVSLPSDVDQFVAEYGGPVQLEVIPGGAHTMHWERIRDTYWSKLFAFLAT